MNSPADPHPELFDRELNGFRFGTYLGQGGSGPVYAGTMVDGETPVAIKVFDIFGVLPEPVRDQFRELLAEEGRRSSAILHPSVAQVLHAGEIDDMPCVVSEFVDGMRLDELLRKRKLMQAKTAVAVVRRVAAGVQVIHDSGLVHGDIKPGNVIIRPDRTPVLVDLGQAKSDPRLGALTRMGREPGTPLYQPPEQLEDAAVTAAGDIFGLGATLLALVTGHGVDATERKRRLQSDVPAALRAVILEAMAKRPADRHVSASALRSALGEAHEVSTQVVDRGAATVIVSGPQPPSQVPTQVVPAPDADSDEDIEELPAEAVLEAPASPGPAETVFDLQEAEPPKPRRKTGATRRPTGSRPKPKTERVEKPKTERVTKPKTEKVEKPKTEKASKPKTERRAKPKTERVAKGKTSRHKRPEKKGGGKKWLLALLLLLLIGGGALAAWQLMGDGGKAAGEGGTAVADAGDGDDGAGDEGTGDEGSGDEGSGDEGSGDEGAGEAGSGDPEVDPAAEREAAAAAALAAAQALDAEADLPGALLAFQAVVDDYEGTEAATTAATHVSELTARRDLLAAVAAGNAALDEAKLGEARTALRRAEGIDAEHPEVVALAARFAEVEAAAKIVSEVVLHISEGELAMARQRLAELSVDHPRHAELTAAIDAAEAAAEAKATALVRAREHADERRWAEAREALAVLAADAPGVAELLAEIEAGEALDAAIASVREAIDAGQLDDARERLDPLPSEDERVREVRSALDAAVAAKAAAARAAAAEAARAAAASKTAQLWRDARDAAREGRNRDAESLLAKLVAADPEHREGERLRTVVRDLPDGLREGWEDDGVKVFVNVYDDAPVVQLEEARHQQGDAEGEASEAPGPQVRVSRFYIDRHEVTNRRYEQFLDWARSDSDPHAYCHADEPKDKDHTPAFWDEAGWSDRDLPVVGVDWFDAYAYAAWAGMALPTEAQWEAAARGTDGRRFPWGDDVDADRANCAELHLDVDSTSADAWAAAMARLAGGEVLTRAPGSFPSGRAPCGAEDMAGNVWEWCQDTYRSDAYENRGSSDPVVTGDGWRVLRGGSWYVPLKHARAANRWRLPPAGGNAASGLMARRRDVGFRCVRNLE